MLAGPQSATTRIRRAAKACRDLLPVIFENKRLSMIDCSDAVTLVSEPAARSVSEYAKALGYPQIAAKIMVMPHPVSPLMVLGDGEKLRKVLVVGRWLKEDRHQKDPELTMTVLEKFLAACPEWTAEVVGRGSTSLDALTRRWPADTRGRLNLTEAVPREQLINRYQSSRILLCCSRFESFHISSAEALCCGCSIVVADHPLLASTGWFTTRNSGSKAGKRSRADLLNALLAETSAWEQNKRNPQQIANDWGNDLHAHQVAMKLLHMLPLHQDPIPFP
jgi:glycosyltransferase involved in cell wall biosynthesis